VTFAKFHLIEICITGIRFSNSHIWYKNHQAMAMIYIHIMIVWW